MQIVEFVKIRATEQVAINTQDKEIRVDSCDSWANKKSVVKRLRGQKTLWAKNFVGKIIPGKKFRS